MFKKEKEAFEELNKRLVHENMKLTVICAGGVCPEQAWNAGYSGYR